MRLKRKQSVEDYLKTIYILSKLKEVHGIHIAEALGISRPTVCVALKALENDGYVTMDAERAVYLTPIGRTIAEQTYERHNTFQQLLVELGVDEKIAKEDACRLEHAVSPESFAALKKLIDIKTS